MSNASMPPVWQRALVILTGTVVAVVVVTCLYWAQSVFVPVALAVFLAFLLAPVVTALQKRGLGRGPSVVMVVLLAGSLLVGLGWLLTTEIANLIGDLPTYTENIKEKVRSLREMSQSPITERLDRMIQEISGELQQAVKTRQAEEKPAPVVLQPDSPRWLTPLPAVVGRVTESLGGLALALVLVIFMLMKREDLRNRLIRLVGNKRMALMTKAVDDAGRRISRYLVMQLVINAGFGFMLTVGLFFIGFPHALLWGFLAAILRYIPYVGSWILTAAIVIIGIAMFPGWLEVLLAIAWIVVLEVAAYNVVEPWLFRQSTGISEVALLVAAAFWAFLWGPIGLVLSSPLTVCLVVLGKYVPQLEFLDVLLGDEPALEPEVSYYQRLLARDLDEATQLALTRAKATSPAAVFDELLIPALNRVTGDREREDASEADEQFVLRATREITEDLGERQADALQKTKQSSAGGNADIEKVRLLACPAGTEADVLALRMLSKLLDPAKWDMEIMSAKTVTSEVIFEAQETVPSVICVCALPPGGLARTRYLCKRLRTKMPDAKILVGRWGLNENVKEDEVQLAEAGAEQVATTLRKTLEYLNAWRPVLEDQKPEPVLTRSNGETVVRG